jgi:hypothetical protein
MSPDTNARFLDTFASLEHHLRVLLEPEKFKNFTQMVKEAANRDAGIQRMRATLIECARIRNFLAHGSNANPVAYLTEGTVTQIQKVRDILLNPPRLLPAFAKEVLTCNVDEPLSTALARMATDVVKKLPVYRGPNLVGLLVAKTITRWLAHCPPAAVPQPSQVQVGDVLKYQDGESLYRLLPATATYFDALAAFQDAAYNKGRHMDALLVTATGSDAGPLLGIVTIAQVPELARCVQA